jgi:5-methylcytosine-specific restriction endonuclease McrA
MVDPRTGWPADAPWAVVCGTPLVGLVPGRPDYPCVDHIIDRADGGSDDPTNLRASCWLCNGRRAAARTNAARRPVNVTRAL